MPHQGQSSQSGRIILVEDDENVRRSLAMLLRAQGFSVDVYCNGVDLLSVSTLPVADCLLIDYKMPGVDGLTLLERLRRGGLETPALLITGLFSNTLKARALKAGFIDVLEKPALFEGLSEKVSDLIAKFKPG